MSSFGEKVSAFFMWEEGKQIFRTREKITGALSFCWIINHLKTQWLKMISLVYKLSHQQIKLNSAGLVLAGLTYLMVSWL